MNEFKWAFGDKADVKEPIDGLKQDGWKYADIPTASNFNWLFKTVGAELKKSSDGLENLKDVPKELLIHKNDIEFSEGCIRQICYYLWDLEVSLKKVIPTITFSPLPLHDNRPKKPGA